MTRTAAALALLLATSTSTAAGAPPVSSAARPAMRPDTVLYGAAYYHEYI